VVHQQTREQVYRRRLPDNVQSPDLDPLFRIDGIDYSSSGGSIRPGGSIKIKRTRLLLLEPGVVAYGLHFNSPGKRDEYQEILHDQ